MENNELTSQEPKQNEITLAAQRITDGLAAFETRKAELTTLKSEVEALKIQSLDDKEGINKVSTARKKLKAARIEIEKEGKSMRDPLTRINRNISAKENELIDIIAPTEKALKVQEDWVKAEELKIEQEEERKEQSRIQGRVDRLATYGYAIDLTFLKGLDDQQFEGVVEGAKKEWDKEQSEKRELERQEKERQDGAEKDRLELQRLREQQAETDRKNKERQDELDRKEKLLKDQQEAEAEKERQRVKAESDAEIKMRIGQVTALGLTFDFSDRHYKGFGCFVPIIDIQTHSKEKWDELVLKITPHIAKEKEEQAAEAEKKRLQDIEDARQKAIAEEQDRQRKAKEKEDEDKRLADLKRQEELDNAGDKAKYADTLAYILATPIHEMRSSQYRTKMKIIRDFVDGLK